MKLKYIFFALLIFLIFSLNLRSQSQIELDSTTLEVDTIITGLNVPWEIHWGPDDHIWMTERHGLISRVDPVNKSREILLDITDKVYQASESGLLGLVLHPDFPDSAYVYTVYTYLDNNSITERLVRYTYSESALQHEEILLDNIPGNNTHDGSRLVISPDRKLFMSTGDARNTSFSQDVSSLAGKILRMELDGSIPEDNPVSGSPVYSWGHRNPQGLHFHPDGTLYSSEHGPSSDDEFQIVMKGRNYGWPDVHGFCDNATEEAYCADSNVVEPLVAWTPTIAPSDLIYYNHDALPEFKGTFLMSVLKDKKIVKLELDESGTSVVSETHYFTNEWGRLRDIESGPDGTIYIATNGESWSNTDPFTHSIISLKKADETTSRKSLSVASAGIKVWPNPSDRIINISVNESGLEKNLQILDVTGKVVLSQRVLNKNEKIAHSLQPGIYFILLDGAGIKKILVE
ncbi:MAG: PQQ-dependent sugar dehydrogenase [Bacteroidota bacterium]